MREGQLEIWKKSNYRWNIIALIIGRLILFEQHIQFIKSRLTTVIRYPVFIITRLYSLQLNNHYSRVITIGERTDARALPVAVAFEPIFRGQFTTIHQRDERRKQSDLRRMYDIYLSAIKKLAVN